MVVQVSTAKLAVFCFILRGAGEGARVNLLPLFKRPAISAWHLIDSDVTPLLQ